MNIKTSTTDNHESLNMSPPKTHWYFTDSNNLFISSLSEGFRYILYQFDHDKQLGVGYIQLLQPQRESFLKNWKNLTYTSLTAEEADSKRKDILASACGNISRREIGQYITQGRSPQFGGMLVKLNGALWSEVVSLKNGSYIISVTSLMDGPTATFCVSKRNQLENAHIVKITSCSALDDKSCVLEIRWNANEKLELRKTSDRYDGDYMIDFNMKNFSPASEKIMNNDEIKTYIETCVRDCVDENIKNIKNIQKNDVVKTSQDKTLAGIKLNILFADDSSIRQQIFKKYWENKGHKVSIASDGQKAIDMFKSDDYSIVILSVFLPVKDGICSVKEMRKFEVDNNKSLTPIIGVLPSGDLNFERKALTEGMTDFINNFDRWTEMYMLVTKYCGRDTICSNVLSTTN